MVQLVLYSRPDCHLCDDARDGLRGLALEGVCFDLVDVDIERDDATLAAYLERIPVVEIAGEVVCELGLDLDAVRARLDTVTA